MQPCLTGAADGWLTGNARMSDFDNTGNSDHFPSWWFLCLLLFTKRPLGLVMLKCWNMLLFNLSHPDMSMLLITNKYWNWCRCIQRRDFAGFFNYAHVPPKLIDLRIRFEQLCRVFSCDQAALWMVQSIRPSVCLSVCPSVRPSHLFSCDQAALWMVFSVCLSVRLSVCLSVTPFWLCSHHRIIMKFSGVITTDQGNVHAKGQGQRSKVNVTEVTIQLSRFRTVTPVWIQIWWWNDAYSLMLLRRGALLFFKVICQISRSHGSKNRRVWPRLGISGL